MQFSFHDVKHKKWQELLTKMFAFVHLFIFLTNDFKKNGLSIWWIKLLVF